MDYEREAIEDYIQVRHPDAIKNDISVLRLGTVMVGLLSLLGCYYYPWFQAVIVLSSMFILWGGWKILTDAEKYQKIHILYMGVAYFLLSFMFFLASIAVFENIFGFKAFQVAEIVGMGYLFVLVAGGYYHIRAVKQGCFSSANQKKAGKKSGKLWALVTIIPGITMTFTVVMKSMFGEAYINSTAIALPLGSYLLLCGTTYIHRYYLMKKYEPYIHIKIHKVDKKSSR